MHGSGAILAQVFKTRVLCSVSSEERQMFHSALARAPASLQAALRSVGLTDADALSDLLSADYDNGSFSRDVVEAGALQQDCGFLPVPLRAAEEARRSTIRIARLSEVQLCGELAVL